MAEEKLSLIEKELSRAKEDLRDLEKYIEEFSSFLPLAVCTVNPVEIIINVNKAFQDLSRYDTLEVTGEYLEKIFLDKKEIKNLLKLVRQRNKVKTKELILISKEGKEIPVSVSISTRKDSEDNFIGYFLALVDITEIKKFREGLEKKVEERTKELGDSRAALMNMLEDVEESRRRSEEEKNKTLTIITNFSDGLLVFDKGKTLSLINPQAERFFEVKEKNVIGKSIPELNAFPKLKTLVALLMEGMKDVYRKELAIEDNLILETSTLPIISKEEGETGMLVILHDISREKMVERIKTEFVSLAAHQLRTPLSAIKWTLKMLLEGDLGEITPEQRDFILKTYQSNERMISLINDLLDVTRIEEGRYLYRPVLTEFENVVQYVINFSREEISRKKMILEFEKTKNKLPKVVIDVEKIKLVIQNLLDNAIKYTPSGGKIKISLKHNKDKKEIEFTIKDTGVGILEEQQPRIFSKFFRGANVMRMETEGSGLGLFISKNIIEAHGGRIWFESKEGEGTAFYFTLPIKEEFMEFLKEF
jgi:two-component system phosphate regulon sensor histidine kinase PhoR